MGPGRLGRASAAPLVQPEDVEAVRAAQDVAHLAWLHGLQRVVENRRQALARAPAHGAALQRIRGFRKRRGDLAEIRAFRELSERLLGARAPRLHLLGARVLRHDDEDVRKIDFVAAHLLVGRRREQRVDLAFGDDDLVVDFALAQPRHDDLVADVLAELRVRHAVALERVAQPCTRDLVLLGDAADRALELGIVDAHPRFLRELELDPVADHALEELALDDRLGGGGGALLGELLHGETRARLELARGDRLVVHDGDDAVEHDRLPRLLARRRPGEQKECAVVSKKAEAVQRKLARWVSFSGLSRPGT